MFKINTGSLDGVTEIYCQILGLWIVLADILCNLLGLWTKVLRSSGSDWDSGWLY